MSQAGAERHLTTAESQLERVQVASWDPTDEDREDAVIWGFYAYENGVIAVAEKAKISWKKVHWDKLDIADDIHSRGHVSHSVRARLEELNELRKDVQYGQAGPDLKAYDLEDLASDLEQFLIEVRKFVEGK